MNPLITNIENFETQHTKNYNLYYKFDAGNLFVERYVENKTFIKHFRRPTSRPIRFEGILINTDLKK